MKSNITLDRLKWRLDKEDAVGFVLFWKKEKNKNIQTLIVN